MAKGKRGRAPRKDVERGSTGRIKTAVHERDISALGKWHRARAIVHQLLPDNRLDSPMGRMLLIGDPRWIDVTEFEAGERFLKILTNYDRTVLGVGRDPRGIDLNSAQGRALAPDVDPDVVSSITGKLMECESVLGMAGPGVASVTKEMVRGGSAVVNSDLVVKGLKALATHWKLDTVPVAKIRRSGEKMRFSVEERTRSFVIVRDTPARGNPRQSNRARLRSFSHGVENSEEG